MSVYWEGEDIGMAILGGALISFSSSLNLYITGRITGLSGMFFTLINLKTSLGLLWKYSFLSGLLSMAYFLYLVVGEYIDFGDYQYYIFDPNEAGISGLNIGGWIIGSFLVGLGTKLGNGCTSGHGVCGLARLSVRSLAAVCTFMACGFGIATLRFHEPFLENSEDFGDGYYDVFRIIAHVVMGLVLAGYVGASVYCHLKEKGWKRYDADISFATGLLFGAGLTLSGMCRRTKIINFLSIGEGWDPSLAFVMGSAIAFNLPFFQLMIKKTQCPLLADSYGLPNNNKIDYKLIGGAVSFGLGWGLCGFCPGPGLVNLFILDHGIIFVLFLAVGQVAAHFLQKYLDKLSQTNTQVSQVKEVGSPVTPDK